MYLHKENKELFPTESVIKDSAIYKASPLHKLTKEQEKARKLGKTSYRMLTGEKNVTVVDYTQEEEVSLSGSNMLVGMEQEVGLILSAIHMGV